MCPQKKTRERKKERNNNKNMSLSLPIILKDGKRKSTELNVRPRPVGWHVKSLLLEEGVSLHASVLVWRTHHGKPEHTMVKMGRWEKERNNDRSVASPPVTTDSRDIVEMGEAHGYGERTGKEKGGKKEEKKMESGSGREVGEKNMIS